MTLDAQFVSGIKSQHIWFVSRSTSLVTAQTSHGKILVSRIYDLFPDRVGRMGLPLVTTATKIRSNRGLRYKQDIIRSMRRVTAYAIARFYRFA